MRLNPKKPLSRDLRRAYILANAKKKAPNPLRVDPSRTAGMRRRLQSALKKWFKELRDDVWALVAEEDAFGLEPPRLPLHPSELFTHNIRQWRSNITNARPRPLVRASASTYNQRWKFETSSQKLQAFQNWLKARMKSKPVGRPGNEQLMEQFAAEGFSKGAGRAFDETKKAERAARRARGGEIGQTPEQVEQSVTDYYKGGKEEFLRSSFGQPVAVDKIKLLASRSFTDLKGVTKTMATKMNRVLAEGLSKGQSPRTIAEDLDYEVGLGEERALTVARTEIIRAHAEGQLDAMEELGVEAVGAMVEWSTAGDELVCPDCAAMDEVVMTIEEARGMIPLHPNCRCAWIPVIPEELLGNVGGQSPIGFSGGARKDVVWLPVINARGSLRWIPRHLSSLQKKGRGWSWRITG